MNEFSPKILASWNTYISDSQKDFHLPCDPFPIASTATKKCICPVKVGQQGGGPAWTFSMQLWIGSGGRFYSEEQILVRSAPHYWASVLTQKHRRVSKEKVIGIQSSCSSLLLCPFVSLANCLKYKKTTESITYVSFPALSLNKVIR